MLSRPPPDPSEARVVVVAASAGGVRALIALLSALPADFPAPIVIVQHRALSGASHLVGVLARRTPLAVLEAESDDHLRAGTVFLARPDRHLTLTHDGTFAYVDGHPIGYVLSSADPLFMSSAQAFGAGVIGVVLSGSGRDGTDGVLAIKAHGGTVIAQNEATSEYFAMPRSAIESGAVDLVLPLDEIAPALMRLLSPDVDKSA